MKEYNKRWLISKLKTSGSVRENLENGNYAEKRHLEKLQDYENLPTRESIKKTKYFYNGKIDIGPLIRFLRGQVGNNWDDIYSEIVARIPSKLLGYKDEITSFVVDKVEKKDGQFINKETQKIIWTQGPINSSIYGVCLFEFPEFFVDPETNKLVRVQGMSISKMQVLDEEISS